MPAKKDEYTINKLSTELGKDRRTLDKALADANVQPVGRKGKSDLYHILDVVKALWEGANLDYTAEKTKLAKAQREKYEVETEQKKGHLIPMEEVLNDARKTATRVKSLLLAVAPRLSAQLASETNEKAIEELIETELKQALESLKTSDNLD